MSKWGRWLPSKIVDWLNRWFFIPDKSIGWVFFAELAGGWLMRREKIDLILVSGPPFSSFLVANQLKRWSGTPYVLDFRESWSLNPYSPGSSPLKRIIEQNLEKRMLKEASAVVMATEPMRQDYCQKYPQLKDKFQTVSNDFNKDDNELKSGSLDSLRQQFSCLELTRKLAQIFDDVYQSEQQL